MEACHTHCSYDISKHNSQFIYWFFSLQRITSSGNTASIDANPVQEKSQNAESLIDLNADSRPSDAAATPQTQENIASGDGDNCSSHESSAKESIPPAPKPNNLELLLLELSVPVVPADNVSGVPSYANSPSTVSAENMIMSSGVSEAVSLVHVLTLPNSAGVSTTASGVKISADSVSAVVPVGHMSTLPSSVSACTAVSGANTLVPSVSPTAPEKTASTILGGSMPVGDVVPAAPVTETLTLLDIFHASSTSSTTYLPEQPSNGGPLQAEPDISGDPNFKVPKEQQVSSVQQHQPSALPAADGGYTQQISNTPVGTLNNQVWIALNFQVSGHGEKSRNKVVQKAKGFAKICDLKL